MRKLEFREPPARVFSPGGTSRLFSENVVAALRENPGQWAVISQHRSYSSGKQKTYIVQNAKTSHWEPAGSFEAVLDTETFEVYARYVGGE